MSENLRLSVSKTKTFLDCKAKYRFAYIEKLPRKDWDFHVFGKFVHKVLEDFHRIYIEGSNEPFSKIMTTVYKQAMTEYKAKMTPEARKEAYEMVEGYLKLISSEKESIKNVLSVEKNFDFHITDHVVLNGMIDRIQLDPDGVVHVCDYKTVKNKKYLKNDFLQLLTYAYVLYSEDPTLKKIRGSYILLRHKFEYITKEFTIDEVLKIKDKYEAYANQIEEERLWRPNPTPLCNFCDYLNKCEGGKSFLNKGSHYGETSWT